MSGVGKSADGPIKPAPGAGLEARGGARAGRRWDSRPDWVDTLLRAARLPRTRIGLALTGLIVAIAVFGPLFAPHSPTEFVVPPFAPPSGRALFGGDELGRDVLSRFLYGGRSVILLSLLSAVLGVGLGATVGLIAAYTRGALDDILMRSSDVMLAFPSIIFALLLIAGLGPHLWLLVVAVALGHAPQTARVIRGASLEVIEREFVKFAELIGVPRRRIVFSEVLPNVATPLLVEFGLRLTFSIALIAGLSFLGFGLQPPAADWGLMINENLLGITSQPWGVVLPILAISLLTVGTNLTTDGVARAASGLDRSARTKRRRRRGPVTERPAVIPVGHDASASVADAPIVDIRALRVDISPSNVDVVDEVSLQISSGEVLGLVGESGCGKTTVGMALLGHCRRGAEVVSGQVIVDGVDVTVLGPRQLRELRGRTVSYIPQDPPTSLNPNLRIGTQLREVLDAHAKDFDKAQRETRLQEALGEVLLPSDETFLRRYPHQLSGGQQQRVAIAMAFVCRPKVIVCDEPTTGLDVTTQARVLSTIRELCRLHGVAALYVSHDLAVVASLADRIAVMYGGRVVETGSRDQLFRTPRHPYSRRLLLAVPALDGRRHPVGITGYAPLPAGRGSGCYFAPRCPIATTRCGEAFPPVTELGGGHAVRCYRASENVAVVSEIASRVPVQAGSVLLEVSTLSASYGTTEVLHEVSLDVRTHECLALVGESGSGKTTLAGCIAGLGMQFRGEVRLNGAMLAHRARGRLPDQRREIQYVFQSPYASLNPRHTIAQSVATPLRVFFGLGRREARGRVEELLERVRLSSSAADKYPDQLSGGERQRVAVARALAAEPSVIICDEITSALDVSVQAAIVQMLARLQREIGLSLLFITHDLALVRTVSDRVAVMSSGEIVESGVTDEVFADPRAPYTRRLLDDTPDLKLDPAVFGGPATASAVAIDTHAR